MVYEEKEACYVRVYKNGKFLTAVSLEIDAEEVAIELMRMNRGNEI